MEVYKLKPIKIWYVKTDDGNIKLFVQRSGEIIHTFCMTPHDITVLYPEVTTGEI